MTKLLHHPILLTALLTLTLTTTGCASTTLINSEPPGASVTIDGRYIGETPVEYSDSGIILTRRQVTLDLPGYQTHHATIARDGDVHAGRLVVGMVCIFPLLLWAMDYPDTATFRLKPEQQEPERAPGRWNASYP